MNLRRFVSFPDNHSQHKTTVCKKICGAFKDQHSSAISTDLTNSRQMELETTRICFKASFSKNLFADHKLKIRITFFLQTSQGQHHKHLNNKDWKKAKSLLTLSEAHWQLTTVRSILCSFQVPHKYHSSSYSYHISVGNILMTLEAPAFKTKKNKTLQQRRGQLNICTRTLQWTNIWEQFLFSCLKVLQDFCTVYCFWQ